MKPKAIIAVQVDKAKFLAEVRELLDISPVVANIKQLAQLRFPGCLSLPMLAVTWRIIYSAFLTVIAAVEIVKSKHLDADGHFDSVIALQTAVALLDEMITFSGVVGKLLDMVDGQILNLLVVFVLGDRHGIDWTSEAKNILGLA